MYLVTLDAAVVAVRYGMTHTLAVLELQYLFVPNLFEANDGKLNSFNSFDMILGEHQVKCCQSKIQLDIHRFCPARNERFNTDNAGRSLRLQFFNDFWS